MDFFNKLGKKASETYQATKEKAANLSEELKLKGKISDLKEGIDEKYSQIGKKVYEEIKAGKDVPKDEILAICDEITNFQEEISKLQTDILAIKKVKKCVNCGEELELNAVFCSKCGREQPVAQKVEVKEEEPQSVKEAEVIEINDLKENNDTQSEDSNNNESEENK